MRNFQVDRMIHWGMLNYCFKFIANRNCEIKGTWNCKTIVKGIWNWLCNVMTIHLWHLRNIWVCQKYVFGLLYGNECLCTEYNLFGIIQSSVHQLGAWKTVSNFQGDRMFHCGMFIYCVKFIANILFLNNDTKHWNWLYLWEDNPLWYLKNAVVSCVSVYVMAKIMRHCNVYLWWGEIRLI